MANPRTYVEAPPVTPLPYGLLSAALVLDDLDGTRGLGVHYEPAFCGAVLDTTGACEDPVDFGEVSISVDAAGEATITADDAPAGGTYTIDWGDDTTADVATPDGAEHTYADAGDYVVLITDDTHGFVATVTVTVEDGEVSGPFVVDAGFAKVPTDGVDLVDGAPFTLYHLFRCSQVGMPEAEFAERARAAMRLGEGRALERVTGSQLPLGYSDGVDRMGAVDLTPTPGTGVSPARAVAELEKYAAANYGGVPVIHVPRDVGSLLGTAGTILRSGARLETVQGAATASGGGYDVLQGPATDPSDPSTAIPAGPGEAWAYVTGQVVVRRSPTIEVGPLMSRTPAINVASALVERLAVVTWECITAAILVDTTVVD